MPLYWEMSFFWCKDSMISSIRSSTSLNLDLVSNLSSIMGMKLGSRKGT